MLYTLYIDRDVKWTTKRTIFLTHIAIYQLSDWNICWNFLWNQKFDFKSKINWKFRSYRVYNFVIISQMSLKLHKYAQEHIPHHNSMRTVSNTTLDRCREAAIFLILTRDTTNLSNRRRRFANDIIYVQSVILNMNFLVHWHPETLMIFKE